MGTRYYANAPATTLVAAISAAATALTVTSDTGLPITYPYTLILDRGEATEEVVEVTAASGTTLTVTRGVDNTLASAHSGGAAVEHGISARDAREANEHINASSNVHGLTGDLVGADEVQALTNKDLTDASNTFPSTLATDAEVTAAANSAQSAAEATAASALSTHEADTSTHGVGEVVGTTEVQTLTNKTLTAPKGATLFGGATRDTAPYAKVARTTGTQPIASSSTVAITFTTDVEETDAGMGDSTNNRIVVPVAGLYLVTGQLRLESADASGGAALTVSGSSAGDLVGNKSSMAGGAGSNLNVSGVVRLSASEALTMSVYQNSGSSKTATATGAGTWLSALWLAP